MIDSLDNIPQNKAYPIWHKVDLAGRRYWGTSSFNGLDDGPILPNQDLSQLEWDGNEVYLDAYTDEDVTDILTKAIGILSFWRNELTAEYPDTSFYLIASYDNGDMLIPGEDEPPVRSVTMRFWADRGDDTVVDLSDFDSWDQPAIIEHIITDIPGTARC